MAEKAFPLKIETDEERGPFVVVPVTELMVGDRVRIRENIPFEVTDEEGNVEKPLLRVILNKRPRKLIAQRERITISTVTRVTAEFIFTNVEKTTVNGRRALDPAHGMYRIKRNAPPSHKKEHARDPATGPQDRSVDILEHSRVANCKRFAGLVEDACNRGLERQDIHALLCETPDPERYGDPLPDSGLVSRWVRGIDEPRPWAWKVMKDIAARPEAYAG